MKTAEKHGLVRIEHKPLAGSNKWVDYYFLIPDALAK